VSGGKAASHNPRDVKREFISQGPEVAAQIGTDDVVPLGGRILGAPTRHGTRTAFVHQMVLTLELVAATSHYISNHRNVDLKPSTELCECK
jgi:hypothetical protein